MLAAQPENHIERGELYFVHLDPSFGREMGGYKPRPVLVVSSNDIHRRTRLVTVVPGTSTPAPNPNVVRVNPDRTNGLTGVTYFQCHQIRAIDQGRMTKSRADGRLSSTDMKRIEEGLRISLLLFEDDKANTD